MSIKLVSASYWLPRRLQRGFTLVELVMVIVVMAVLGLTIAVFMRGPIDAYFDTARRAAMADAADSTLRRMARDVRLALPNSIRVSGDGQCMDLIPTRTGGRYRTTGANALTFPIAGTGNTTFNMLGANSTAADQAIAVGDVLAFNNFGIPGASAYENTNTATVTTVTVAAGANPAETTITFTNNPAGLGLALESPSSRFQVVPAGSMVSYVCVGGNLRRTVSAGFAPICANTGPVIARNVSACNFLYNANSQRDALVRLTLGMTQNSEAVTLMHEVHVDNTP